MDLLGWFIFLFALLFSLMLHESGHFATAKMFGIKATKYFIGFGPTLWSVTRGETEYGIKALPIGGYVKVVGMTSLDEVDPEDEARSFRRAPGWQRLIVMFAGVAAHFALALVLLFGVAIGIGIANYGTTQIGTVAACVQSSERALNSGAACTPGEPKSPALLAGLRPGDTITSFDGTRTPTWDRLTTAIKDARPDAPVTMTVLRDGRTVTLHAPALATVKGRSGGYLGIGGAAVFERASPLRAVEYTGSGFWQELSGSARALAALPGHVSELFARNRGQTQAGSVTSVVGVADITGQAVAAHVGWQAKVSFVLLIIAAVNIAVGLFNLLPLLPLDGGHIAAILFERTRAWLARLRGRPDPGLVDYRKLVPVSFSLFVVLMAVAVLLVYADIVNPVSIQ